MSAGIGGTAGSFATAGSALDGVFGVAREMAGAVGVVRLSPETTGMDGGFVLGVESERVEAASASWASAADVFTVLMSKTRTADSSGARDCVVDGNAYALAQAMNKMSP
ncbi:MAG: hypothetical protein NTX50_01755 [Candidatus Sumerlaeota bacterium]|nr:hypothetical protein [Candidatus Sumerlaeota bacterium]